MAWTWGQKWHRLMREVSEWISFAFAGFAYNWHMARSFEAAACAVGAEPAPALPGEHTHITRASTPATPNTVRRVAAAIADLVPPGTGPPG